MNHKPTYLGTLNAIANAEAAAEHYLAAWAKTTPSPEVRQVLTTVALREGEHGKAFAKRLCELGYEVQPRTDGKSDERMEIAASTALTDREKFEKLRLANNPATVSSERDFFSTLFDDKSIDIQTGTLLGRYIAEERDSGRLLDSCYCALVTADAECAAAGAASNGTPSTASTSSVEDRLDKIETMLCELLARS